MGGRHSFVGMSDGEAFGGGRLRQFIFNVVVTQADNLGALFNSIYILINECVGLCVFINYKCYTILYYDSYNILRLTPSYNVCVGHFLVCVKL